MSKTTRRSRALVVVAGVLLLVVVVISIPVDVGHFVSNPSPATDYADAVQRVRRRQAADDLVATPGGSTVLLTHGARTPRVVVLFHGFTNSPRQYEYLAARLYQAGDNVYVPRLPHHAERHGTARTLSKLTAEELTETADSAIDIARGLGDSVIAAGVSAGGTVVAWIAQQRADVERSIIIAPVLEIGRVPSPLATPLMHLALRIPNMSRSESPDLTRPDRELSVSTRAIAQLLRLGQAVRLRARQIGPRTSDIVFVVNANDHTVKSAPAVQLARDWANHGAAAVVYQFPRALNLPHDIAEVAHPNADTAVVYPALEALIDGRRAPAALSEHRLWPP